MNSYPQSDDQFDDNQPWTIPLHGIPIPLNNTNNTPPSADTPTPLTSNLPPSADTPEDTLPFGFEDIPTDVGYHPRLRKSA
jgi:hypothetical protein